MVYKEFKNLKLSTLGYGGMRFPMDNETEKIDEREAAAHLEYAYNNGVNFFDTAFFYNGGESERLMGEVLAKFPRDTWYLSDKFPGTLFKL